MRRLGAKYVSAMQSLPSIKVPKVPLGINRFYLMLYADDCSHWPITRIKARLDMFRVPKGAQVHLVMERRVRPSEEGSAGLYNQDIHKYL